MEYHRILFLRLDTRYIHIIGNIYNVICITGRFILYVSGYIRKAQFRKTIETGNIIVIVIVIVLALT